MTALECPYCHSFVVFPADMAGKAGACPNCAREIPVPSRPATEEQLREFLRRLTQSSQGKTLPRDETKPDLPMSSRSDTDV